MEYRTLGRTGLQVSEVGLGARTIGRDTDDEESIRALHRAIDLGVNFFDTADAYGDGHSEELFAQVLKTRRNEVILATKGGQVRRGVLDFSPEYITGALEASLRRLQIDTIDLYQLHNGTPEAVEQGDVFDLLDRFKRDGKIRYYGVSLWDSDDGMAAIKSGRPDALQVVYNILHQQYEEELFPLCQRDNIGILARVPLERGLLSGKYTDFAANVTGQVARYDRFTPEEFEKVTAAVDKLKFLVTGDVESLGEAALRFCLSHPAVSTVIPGMQRVANVEANVKASKGPLPEEDLARLRELYRTEFRHIALH